jgi:hypothetical protein
MVDFDLGSKFDVISCLFSSIAYVKTTQNMMQAVANMARHLRAGGLLFVEPWFSLENYWTGRITANFVDRPDLKIAWMYTSELEGSVSVLDINFLVGQPNGVDYFKERHEMGLFSRDEYLAAFENAGLDVTHDPNGLFGRGLYIGTNSRKIHE